MNTITNELSYEEAFGRLEETLARLESGDLPLEETMALYEQGVTLAEHCMRKLDEAELRVRLWQNNGQAVPFQEWQKE
jgi:exodeoxyribonuclease VII small subunit